MEKTRTEEKEAPSSTKEVAIRKEEQQDKDNRSPMISSSRVLTTLVPGEHELQVYQTMAVQAEGSRFYQNMGGKSGILSMMLYARELGIAPMTAISGGLWNIQGRIEMSARMINKRIRESGHLMQIVELNSEKCVLMGRRRDTGEELTVTFTIEDAKKAGLVKKDSNWEKWPEDMVFARAISRLGRRLYPDIIGNAYVEGEISDFIDMEPMEPPEIKPTDGREGWGFKKPETEAAQVTPPEAESPAEEESAPAETGSEQPPEMTDDEKRIILIEDIVKHEIMPFLAKEYGITAKGKIAAAMNVIKTVFGVETLRNVPAEQVKELMPYVTDIEFKDDLIKWRIIPGKTEGK